jgi:Tol biopolymer transport system component
VAGTIGYITPDGNFGLMDGNGGNQGSVTSDGTAKAFAWSPEGPRGSRTRRWARYVSVVRPDGAVADIAGGSAPLWSPGGDRLAVSLDGSVALYDASGNVLRVFDTATRPAWSPDGTLLAFLKVGANGKAVPVVGQVSTGQEAPLDPNIEPADPLFPIAWHPSGSIIAYSTKLYEPATGRTVDLPGRAVYWSPDGRRLLVAGVFNPGTVLRWAHSGLDSGFKQIIGHQSALC